VRKIILGKTNCEVSAISLGTWAFGGENMSGNFSVGWEGQNKEDSEKVLKKAWEVGINHWDTADVYGDGKSESIIGNSWNKIPRNEIFIATKFGWDRGPYKEWYNPKHMRNNFERSLKNLKTDYVDLLYLHHCSFGKNDELLNDAILTIRQFQSEGKVRFIGLSDWSSKKILKYIDACNPDVVQPYYNVMDNQYITSGLKKYVDDNNIGACFFSPIKHGLLTGKYNKPTTFKNGDHRSRIKEFKSIEILQRLKENKLLLEKHFKSEKHPVLFGLINSLLYASENSCVLLGQRNENQVEVASSLGGQLSREEVHWIKQLYNFKNN
jgi:aryl-alcohol dehydrogenase-like predicted oxidoreductase